MCLHVGLGLLDKVVLGHAELLHDDVTRGRETKALDRDDLAVKANILVPVSANTCLHGNALRARLRQHLLLVGSRLLVEYIHAGHRDNTHAVTELGSGLDGMLHLRA